MGWVPFFYFLNRNWVVWGGVEWGITVSKAPKTLDLVKISTDIAQFATLGLPKSFHRLAMRARRFTGTRKPEAHQA
jgi:hypothetical protein